MNNRAQICHKCPIYDSARDLCNGKLYLNPNTNDVSTSIKPGYKKGCNCIISRKVLNSKNKCPAGKW